MKKQQSCEDQNPQNLKISGGEAILRSVVDNGVKVIFGLPGAQIYPLFDAMAKMKDRVKFIPVRHEQGAAYMALGYAQSTGKPSVFAVVPGPGVLNASAALCTALATNSPVMCLTGQIPSNFLGKGRGHLHELPDQLSTVKGFVKWADRIDSAADASRSVNDGFRRMMSGRRGPVSLEMCWDVMANPAETSGLAAKPPLDELEVNQDQIKAAAAIIKGKSRPMIMCGGGSQGASKQVLELAKMLGAAVTSFRGGRGVVSEDHELGVSSAAGYELWADTDVIIGIGSRMEMQYLRWTHMMQCHIKPPKGTPPLVRIDIDPEEHRRLIADAPILADAAQGVEALIKKLEGMIERPADSGRITAAKLKTRKAIMEIQPQMDYLDVIRDVLPRDGFFVEELSQMGFTSYFGMPIYNPRTYIASGYQGTLGFGFPTALGVKVAHPDKAVVSVTGDGGFLFAMPELSSAVENKIGLITIIFNNNVYCNIRRDQMTNYEGRLMGADLVNPDYMKLAESFGVQGYRVSSPAQLRPALEKAIAQDVACLIEVQTPKGAETSPWKFIHPNM